MPPKTTTLFLAPTGQSVEAQIVELTPRIAERRIHRDWWAGGELMDQFDSAPIDRNWNWNEMGIEYDGRPLESMNVAIVTRDRAVQGAMMVSTEPVPSILTAGNGALFVELLFTAPRNREKLRRDGKPLFRGVGTKLLAYAVHLSREKRQNGRLRLDASPDHVIWYEKRGLQKLKMKPIVFEQVTYVPMELPSRAAQKLLKDLE